MSRGNASVNSGAGLQLKVSAWTHAFLLNGWMDGWTDKS